MKLKYLAISLALAALTAALPARADSNGYTPSKNGYIGGATGFAAGAGGTAYYLKQSAKPQSGSNRVGGAKPAKMKDAAGRLNRHKDAAYNRQYLDRFGEDHARKIDKAKREQALKNKAVNKKMRARDLKDKKLAKQNPKAAKHLKEQRRLGEEFNAQQDRKKKMRKVKKLAGKDGVKAARKNQRIVKKGAKNAAKVAKTGKKLRKLKTVGKIATGGAVGMVAGAAMGEHIPDAFDAAAYTYKMARNPKDAPKMLANTAKGGVAMAGRMALTVTDPGKMARNLQGAAKGVGRSIANTGVYKSVAKTKTGRAIGKAATWTTGKVSKGYKSLARTKTGKAVGAAARTVDRQVFKRANAGVKATGKALSKGSKVAGKIAKTSAKEVGAVAKKTGKKAKKSLKKAGKALKKAFHL